MIFSSLFLLLVLLSFGYLWGTKVALARKKEDKKIQRLPKTYGWFMVCCICLISLLFSCFYLVLDFFFPFFLQNTSFFWGGIFTCFLFGLASSRILLSLCSKPHYFVERIIIFGLFLTALVAILTSIAVILSLLFEAYCFFQYISPFHFLFGLEWSPQLSHYDPSNAFGSIPLFLGTFLITSIALLIALPFGVFVAVYLAEYSSKKARLIFKPLLEMLAGIPTVVYGFFAIMLVAPLLQKVGDFFHLSISSESALAAGLVMGIMLIPFISSLSDDVIRSIPQALRDAGLGLGATKSETIRHIVLPAAFPGIVGATLLAISRAIGETMLVVMAAGLSASLTLNPLKSVTTVTVQIVSLLTGDQEFDNPQTLAAFALGLILFIVTLTLNFLALKIMRAFKEQYD